MTEVPGKSKGVESESCLAAICAVLSMGLGAWQPVYFSSESDHRVDFGAMNQ